MSSATDIRNMVPGGTLEVAEATVDLRSDGPPLTRSATIDLSGLGSAIELDEPHTRHEVVRLSLGHRTVHVLNNTHPLVPSLLSAELAAVSSGSSQAEFAAWLGDVTGAQFVVVSDAMSNEALSAESVIAQARLTLHPRCDRSLRELARLLGRNPEDVINDFRDRSGFSDLHGLVDLTTIAVSPAMALTARQFVNELGYLLDAVGTVLLVLAGRGDVTLATTSLDEAEQNWLRDAGWPLAECFDADLASVLRGDRSRAGRTIPSWLRLHGLWGAVAAQRTSNMMNIATHLHRNHIDLGACIPRARTTRY